MKKLLPFIVLLTCLSCLTEERADLGKASTFIRYFNGGYYDQPQAFDETPDGGFAILVSTGATKDLPAKIKLIKTDSYGNRQWQTLYPNFGTDYDYYYKGSAMLIEKDGTGTLIGYTIVGTKTDRSTGVSNLFLIKLDEHGEPIPNKSITLLVNNDNTPMDHVEGHAITKGPNGNYLVLAARNNGATKDMVLAEFDTDDLSLNWSREYGEGGSSFITGLNTAFDAGVGGDVIIWGGTVDRLNGTAMRLVKTGVNEEGALFNNDYGTTEFNESLGSVCFMPAISRFLLIGTTDENGSKDVLLKQVSISGDELQFQDDTKRKIFGSDGISEEGNAICQTNDGFLIIGTSGNASGLEEGNNYFMIKLNFLGEKVWSRAFGSKKADKGVGIMQASDGSYVILGSTTLGGRGSTMLMKTNSRGSIR